MNKGCMPGIIINFRRNLRSTQKNCWLSICFHSEKKRPGSSRLNCLHQQDSFFALRESWEGKALSLTATELWLPCTAADVWGSGQKLIEWCAKRFPFLMDSPMDKQHKKSTQQPRSCCAAPPFSRRWHCDAIDRNGLPRVAEY